MYTALDFLKTNLNKIKNLSIRTLIDVARIINNNSDSDWESLAEYVIYN
jgi:hypothetical protein